LLALACACCNACQAGATASGGIGRLILGPSATDMPHQHMAQLGSSLAASRNERIASAWLKPNSSLTPWSKSFCASGIFVEIGWRWSPRPVKTGAPGLSASPP
jgi:hypothetical protein